MKRTANILAECIFIIYALFGLIICFLNLFYSSENYACKKTFLLSNIQLFLLGVFTIVFIWILSYLLVRKNIHIQLKKINITTLTIIFFIVQIYVFYNMYFHADIWDPATIYKSAELISRGEVNGLDNSYFSMYPNNQLIVYLQSIMIRLNRIFGIWDSEGFFFMIVVQCLLSSWTGKLLYENLRLLNCSEKYSLIGWIVYVLLLGLSGWNVVTYTDMMGLIFPIAIFRVYLALKNKEKVMMKWLTIVALTYWGSKIKVTVLIIFLALVISEVIQFIHDFEIQTFFRKIKTFAKFTIAGGLSIFLFANLFNIAIQSTGLIIDKEANMGTLHWMMMGLNPENDGVYFYDDVVLSQKIENKSERTQAQIDKINERLRDYGIKGFVEHIGRKSLIDFNDGTFAWGCEGGFYGEIYPDKNSVISPFLKSLYYEEGSRYLYFSTLEQFMWIITFFGSIGIVIVNHGKKDIIVISLSLIGIIMFNLMFEARARYMILYVPFFIMAAMVSWQGCEIYLRKKLRIG